MKALTIPQRMIRLLSDMKLHKIQELLDIIGDPEARYSNVHSHIKKCNALVRQEEKEIICQTKGMVKYYRMIWNTDTSPREQEANGDTEG